MLTEFHFQSATHVKNTIVFYYIHVTLHTLAISACGIVLSVFVMKRMKFPYLNYLKSLTSQFLTLLKRIFWPEETCALQLPGQVVMQLVGVGFIMMKHKMQFSVLSVFCYGGIPEYLWLAIAVALAYVLIYYYGNTYSNGPKKGKIPPPTGLEPQATRFPEKCHTWCSSRRDGYVFLFLLT